MIGMELEDIKLMKFFKFGMKILLLFFFWIDFWNPFSQNNWWRNQETDVEIIFPQQRIKGLKGFSIIDSSF